ncbi:MAG TPA: restriction endonuclease subunit S [Cyclobacteriaceae bacterium]|nr:restriction endonuclease subunit S [Cyclobacteriaceae bacterium]
MSKPYNEAALGTIADFSYGYTATAQDTGDTRFIRITDIDENGSLKKNDAKFIDFTGELERYQVKKGDILVARTGGTFGKTLLYKDDCPAVYASFLIKIILNNGDLLPDFYFHFSQSNRYWFQANNLVTGGGQPQFNANVLKEIVVPLPPLPEQKAIADLLSTWDEAIEKTERLIQAKEANLKGQIQRIMGKEAIEVNGWSMVHLGELFSEVTRKVGEKELTPYSISAGIGFVSQREKWGKDISGSQHKNYTHLKAGEFSYNKGNSKRYQQGCVYLLKNGEICVPNVFISFKPKAKNVVPEFFEHYFIADYHARELKRYITSGARSDGLLNLNKKDFFKIMVPCPSPDEQKAIAEALTASQHEIDLLKQLADKYKTQKRGLMQKMLTGEWRVKPEIVNQYREA